MASTCSVSSPRRMLSLSKKRAIFSSTELEEKDSAYVMSETHGTKSSEIVMDSYSISSPRRILNLSKKRATVSFADPEEKEFGLAASEVHGPKPSEVYGFVGSITTIVATVLFLIWAYTPEHWLHSIGITYYPNRYWALAVPTYAMVTIVLAMGFYIGMNFLATPPPTSFYTVFDEHSREPPTLMSSVEGNERPIEPYSDIGIDLVNDLMFNALD